VPKAKAKCASAETVTPLVPVRVYACIVAVLSFLFSCLAASPCVRDPTVPGHVIVQNEACEGKFFSELLVKHHININYWVMHPFARVSIKYWNTT
jgi:hypothetical protein